MESRTSNMLWSNQARINALIAATTDVVYRMSPDWGEMWLLLGRDFISDTCEPTQTWLTKYIHPDDHAQVMGEIRAAIRTKSVFEIRHRVLRIDGTLGWTFSRAVPLLGDDGEILEWIGSARDITEQKEMERRLSERSDDLVRLAEQIILLQHQERRRITEQLNEDLQQLLVAGLMKTRLLLSSASFSDEGDLAELDRALSEAVATARGIAKSLVPPVSLSEQLPDALQWLANDMREKQGLRLCAEIDDSIGFVSETTGVLLFTAARELLMNVIEHAGIVEAELELIRENEGVNLVVRDHGDGFDPTRTPAAGRDGFGLLSIEERVRLVGGHFAMHAAPGQGVEVRIGIPDATKGEGSRQTVFPSEIEPATIEDALARAGNNAIRIVIADDHTVVREALCTLLSEVEGLEVAAECSNGREAVDQALLLCPAVVIMDVNMPVMDGVEATRLIKAQSPGIKVIGLSVYSEAEGGDQMRAAGADAYVSKTAPPEDLIEQIFLLSGEDGEGRKLP